MSRYEETRDRSSAVRSSVTVPASCSSRYVSRCWRTGLAYTCLLGWVSRLGMGSGVFAGFIPWGKVDGWHPSGALTDDGMKARYMSNWERNQLGPMAR